MNKNKTFSLILSKIRKDCGFSSAYNFFKNVGGSKTLDMAFVSYWDIERGKKLPKAHRLNNIIGALGLKLYSSEGKELIKAYFTALLGAPELLHTITAPVKNSEMDLAIGRTAWDTHQWSSKKPQGYAEWTGLS